MGFWFQSVYIRVHPWLKSILCRGAEQVVAAENFEDAGGRQGLDRTALVAGDCRRHEERVVDGFFRRLLNRLEERGHGVIGEELAGLAGGGEGDDVLAAAIARGRAGHAEAEFGARGQPAQIARVDRRVGGDHDHAGAARCRLGVLLEVVAAELAPYRRAHDREDAAEIGLHQHPDRVAAQRGGEHARGRTDAALVAEADGPRARTHGALGHGAWRGGTDGRDHVFLRHRPAADVVERAVIGFAHQRVDAEDLLIARLGEGPLHRAGDALRHAQRIGQDDGCLQIAQLLDLRAAGELAEGIRDVDTGRDLLLEEIAAVRQDRGHARAEISALMERHVPDHDACHIRDRVERSGRQDARDNSQVAGPAAGRVDRNRQGGQEKQGREQEF